MDGVQILSLHGQRPEVVCKKLTDRCAWSGRGIARHREGFFSSHVGQSYANLTQLQKFKSKETIRETNFNPCRLILSRRNDEEMTKLNTNG